MKILFVLLFSISILPYLLADQKVEEAITITPESPEDSSNVTTSTPIPEDTLQTDSRSIQKKSDAGYDYLRPTEEFEFPVEVVEEVPAPTTPRPRSRTRQRTRGRRPRPTEPTSTFNPIASQNIIPFGVHTALYLPPKNQRLPIPSSPVAFRRPPPPPTRYRHPEFAGPVQQHYPRVSDASLFLLQNSHAISQLYRLPAQKPDYAPHYPPMNFPGTGSYTTTATPERISDATLQALQNKDRLIVRLQQALNALIRVQKQREQQQLQELQQLQQQQQHPQNLITLGASIPVANADEHKLQASHPSGFKFPVEHPQVLPVSTPAPTPAENGFFLAPSALQQSHFGNNFVESSAVPTRFELPIPAQSFVSHHQSYPKLELGPVPPPLPISSLNVHQTQLQQQQHLLQGLSSTTPSPFIHQLGGLGYQQQLQQQQQQSPSGIFATFYSTVGRNSVPPLGYLAQDYSVVAQPQLHQQQQQTQQVEIVK